MNVSDLMKWLAFYGNLYCGVYGCFRRGWVPTEVSRRCIDFRSPACAGICALGWRCPECLATWGAVQRCYGNNASWNISGGSGIYIYIIIYKYYIYMYNSIVGGIVVRHYHYLLTNCTFFWVRVNDWHMIHPTKETLTFTCWIYWMWR